MLYYAGLDISMKETSIAITDEKGKFVFETVCSTDPGAISNILKKTGFVFEKIGLESGCITFWLMDELNKLGLTCTCIDAKEMSTILCLKINKTDRNDARLIANAMRCALYKEVHHKTKESIEIGVIMGTRRTLVNSRTHLKNSLRGFLKAYGIRITSASHNNFPEAVRKSIKGAENSVVVAIEGLLKSYEEVCRNIEHANNELGILCKEDSLMNLFQTIPGVGPITALTFKAVIDNPYRFTNPRNLGAYLGLTPEQYSSGETVRQGRISKCGSSELRSLLVECAVVMLTKTKSWSKLKAWGLKLMKKNGIKKAASAVARKLAIIMLRMWQDGKEFIFGEKKDNPQIEPNNSKTALEIKVKSHNKPNNLKRPNGIPNKSQPEPNNSKTALEMEVKSHNKPNNLKRPNGIPNKSQPEPNNSKTTLEIEVKSHNINNLKRPNGIPNKSQAEPNDLKTALNVKVKSYNKSDDFEKIGEFGTSFQKNSTDLKETLKKTKKRQSYQLA
jgi:transposase